MALGPLRGPDIILRPGIPHEATSDVPLAPVILPPESASNHADDQSSGTPKEITGEEVAAAVAARAATPEVKPEVKVEPKAKTDEPAPLNVADPYADAAPADQSPEAIKRQVIKERETARQYREAVEVAARAAIGDEAWDAAVKLSRDKLVQAERERANKASKEARESREAMEAARQEANELRAKIPAPPAPPVDAKPTREQFDDPDLYDTALTEWGEREGTRKVEARLAEERRTTEAATAAAKVEETRVANEAASQKIQDSWNEKVVTAQEKYPDYMEVTMATPENGGPTISDPMVAALVEADNGPDVAYFLGQNPDESQRIAALPTVAAQMLAIGRLAERIANPPRRRSPPPAPPIEPIDTGTNTADTSEVEPDMASYAAKRLRELNADRRPFFPAERVH